MLFTHHALEQASRRGISQQAIVMAMDYGRRIFKGNGAVLYFLGQREVDEYSKVDLQSYLGVHVLCDAIHNVVLTVYKNRTLRTRSNR